MFLELFLKFDPKRVTLYLGFFLGLFTGNAAIWPQAKLVVSQGESNALLRIETDQRGSHRIEIDDAPSFQTPLLSRVFRGSTVQIDINAAGLIPGLPYRIRLDGGPSQQLGLAYHALDLPVANCATLHNTWTLRTRTTLGVALSGLRWENAHWVIKPHTFLLGESLYNAELLLRPAIAAARACGDLATLDEIAQYFTIMLRQTETVRDLLSRPRVTAETRARLASANGDARSFSATFGSEAGEGELYNAQWMHPAALLVRIVTLIEPERRTPAMQEFAQLYTTFIVKDQLHRYLFEQTMPPLGGVAASGRVAHWEQAMQGKKGRVPWDSAVSDIDLWWLASAAEMLGAHANDAQAVAIDPREAAWLQAAIDTGVRFLESERTLHPETKDFNGNAAESATYFDGDEATDPDMLYSAVGGPDLPREDQRRALPNVSWDSSHIYRLAICLRALYENRKAFNNSRLQFRDLQLIANQYIYKVFNGDFTRPLFSNYFDGSDGWFRVGYTGDGFGNPPSSFCDMHNPKRLCLMPGDLLGWPELAFTNPDLERLERTLIALSSPTNLETGEFADRHYFWNGPYKPGSEAGSEFYQGLLYFVVAENAERLAPAARSGMN